MNHEDRTQCELRRWRLIRIVDEHFARDNVAVVRAIKEQTRQDVSVRSLQTWLIDPARKSHRTLPGWALEALEQYVAREDKQELLTTVRRDADLRRAQPYRFDHSEDVLTRRSVEIATDEVESEEREASRWREHFGTSSGTALAKQFRSMAREIESMATALAAVTRALHLCHDYEEFRRHAEDAIRDANISKYSVRETRDLYQRGAGEFQSANGLPPSPASTS